MPAKVESWDYLIVTASNDSQAKAYESQLKLRSELGLLGGIRNTMVVADLEGKRIGSGGSTLLCLIQVLNRELGAKAASSALADWEQILRSKRILIIHAGGDSRRLPAYGPCGKIFVPVPGREDGVLPTTLFDRQLPGFTSFPPAPANAGQVIVTAGDALMRMDWETIDFSKPGMTALGCYEPAEASSKHGVFVPQADGQVRIYLQKPKVAMQQELGALNEKGESILDIGVMSFDAQTAVSLLKAFNTVVSNGQVAWTDAMLKDMLTKGVDIYREVMCALGTQATIEHFLTQCKSAGSPWDEASLRKIHAAIGGIRFNIVTLAYCSFLHFGTTKQLITSGVELCEQDHGHGPADSRLELNNTVCGQGSISARECWIEACRISSPLELEGKNVLVGVNVKTPLTLAAGMCLDIVEGFDKAGKRVSFIRPYGISDTFKDSLAKGGTFCGMPLADWMQAMGVKPSDLWDAALPEKEWALWDAKVFPADPDGDYARWLWMLNPASATAEQKAAFVKADRYSTAQIAWLTDQDAFYSRRRENHAKKAK